MKISKFNWIFAASYIALSIFVLVYAIISPAFREYAKAPLRDFFLPEPEPIVVNLLYSTEKEAWLKESIQQFENAKIKVNGHPIIIETNQMGSREMVLAILDGKEKPTLVSPASMLQASILSDQSEKKFGRGLISVTDPDVCQPVIKSPLVLVAWKERAQALWGNEPPEDFWNLLHDALINPRGWEVYGEPDWGYIKFGHTSPETSNSGLMTIVLMTYDYFDITDGLTSQDILSNDEYQKWLLGIEGSISSFGDSTGTYMKDIVSYGPSVYDFVTVYEATAIEQSQNAIGRYGELSVYYPPNTLMSDHPFCLVTADWVTNDQKEASRILRNFLLKPEAQKSALNSFGFRPVDPSINLLDSESPFVKYPKLGLKENLPSAITIPEADVLSTLLDFWHRNVK